MKNENTVNVDTIPENTGVKPKKSKKTLIIAAAVAILLVFIVSVVGGKKTVDMKDYVEVTFSGVDGKGRALLSVNYDGMVQSVMGDKKQSENLQDAANNLVSYLKYAAQMRTAVYCTLDRDSGLSNGDEVTVTVNVDENACKELKIKVNSKKLTFKVRDLLNVVPFDAFSEINVEFRGISPNATARIVNNATNPAAMSYYYSLDKDSGLANGDTVTVSISENNIDRVAEETGKVPAEMQKQYVVSGLSSYVAELKQIPEDALIQMQRQAEDALTAYVAKKWNHADYFGGAKYVGSYLLTKKPGDRSGNANVLTMVYDVSYVDPDVTPELHYFYYTSFYDLCANGDGGIDVDLTKYRTPDKNYKFPAEYGNYFVYGYETLADLFRDCVAKYVDNYTYDSSIAE